MLQTLSDTSQPRYEAGSGAPRGVPRLPLALAGAAAAVAAGYVVAHGTRSQLLLALLAAFLIAGLLSRFNRGLVIGIVLLGILNGFPVVDLSSYSAGGSLKLSDALILLLIGGLYLCAIGDFLGGMRRRVPSVLLAASAILAAWWAITFLRTWFYLGIPPLKAALLAREYLYFALLAPAMALAVYRRRDVVALAWVLGAAAIAASIGAIGTTLFHLPLSALDHPYEVAIGPTGIRPYISLGDVIPLLVPFGVAVALFDARTTARWLGAGAGLLGLTAVVVLQTRAVIIALPLALVAAAALWARAPSLRARRARRMLASLAAVLLAGLALLLLTSSPSTYSSPLSGGSQLSGAVARVAQTPTEISTQSGNVGYRYRTFQKMAQLLGHDWPVGLGFLHPDVDYEPTLPSGSIRNADLGVMNSVMTLGVIGTLALYLLVLSPLRALGAPPSDRSDPFLLSLRFTAAAWICFAVIGSLTLITLHSSAGLTLTASVMAIGLAASDLERHRGADGSR